MSHDRESFRGQGKQTMIIKVSADVDVKEIRCKEEEEEEE